MKRLLSIGIIILCAFILVECEKESCLLTKNTASTSLPEELQVIHNQMPICEIGNITVIGDGILKFQSEAHYDAVYTLLRNHCDLWDSLFLSAYQYMTEDELEAFEDSIGYNEYQPLIDFERQLGVSGIMLRDVQERLVQRWLDNGMIGDDPSDSIMIDEIEQTLFSPYHEICIGSTIMQLRPDGSIILLPESHITDLPLIRSMTTSDIIASGICDVKGCKPGADLTFNDHEPIPVHKTDEIYMSSTKKSVWKFSSKPRFCFFTGNYKIISTTKLINYQFKRGKWRVVRRSSRISSYLSFHSVVETGSSLNPPVTVQMHYNNNTQYGNPLPLSESYKKRVTDRYVYNTYLSEFVELGIGINSEILCTIEGVDKSRLIFQ